MAKAAWPGLIMIIDIHKGKLDVCGNCSHQIFFQDKVTKGWMHFSPVVARTRCSIKSCNCGGDGMKIYGENFNNQKCGICNNGIICSCTNPIPMVRIIDGKVC
ncbi:MAG: hypothetical protein WA799_08930 [Nitrosotalea sp.]